MRAMRDLIKDRHGTWNAQRRVPPRLQEAVARVLGNGKAKQVFLKKSLGTKDLREANVAAKHVLAGFDRTLGEAEALLRERPVKDTLTPAQIKRVAESYYASILESDEEERREGTGSEAVFQSIAKQLTAAGVEFRTPFDVGSLPEAGLSDREVYKREELLADQLPSATAALAKGDITHVRLALDELLDVFQINLDRKSLAYRQLGMAVLGAHVRALKDVERRNAGEPIETPAHTYGPLSSPVSGSTLRNAVEGWQKERPRPAGTVHEYKRAVEMFIELHGDLPVAEIKKTHAREFREAVQQVPQRRVGALRTATLPEMSAWGHKHPSVPKVSAGTVNKQLGALQAIAGWADQNGVIPDDIAWSNPFSKMKVEEEQSERTSFETTELQLLFAAPVFTKHQYPMGARGPAAFWLPLLALFTGARQAELAGLTVENVQTDAETSTPLLYIAPQVSRGKRLKTASSQRVIAVHPHLVKLGFLEFVDDVRQREGDKAWLFPLVAPDKGRSGVAAYSKWFGRYLRKQGVSDTAKVFHSFRHSVNDALRRGRVDEELRKALVGHAHSSRVDYGAKQMLTRWGAAALKDAVSKISYPGLDLSRVRPFATSKSARRGK